MLGLGFYLLGLSVLMSSSSRRCETNTVIEERAVAPVAKLPASYALHRIKRNKKRRNK